MINIHHEHGTNILYTTAVGRLEQEDYDRMLPEARQLINDYGKIRWYFEMEDFSGWTTGSAWRDVKFDLQHAGDFEKVAVVGQSEWMDWATQFMKPFTSGEVRYFSLEEQAEAKEWIAS